MMMGGAGESYVVCDVKVTSNGEEETLVGVLGMVVVGESLVGEGGVGSDRRSEAWFNATSFDRNSAD